VLPSAFPADATRNALALVSDSCPALDELKRRSAPSISSRMKKHSVLCLLLSASSLLLSANVRGADTFDHTSRTEFKRRPVDVKLPFTCTVKASVSTCLGSLNGGLTEDEQAVTVSLLKEPEPFHLRVSVFGKRADVSGATMFGLATGTNDRGDAHYWFEAISDTGYFRVFQLAQPGVTFQLAVDLRKGAFVLTTSRSDDYAFIVSSVSGSVAND
jgi:hypothetical protein